jgi:hypothetical protein
MKIKPLVISLAIIIVMGFGGYFILGQRDIAKDEISQINAENKNLSDNEDTKSSSVLPLSNSDFVIMDDNNYIELNGKYEELITDNKITETIEPNEIHTYYIYVYENFKILSDGNEIAWIDLTTPVFQTSRGIKLGDAISKVIKKYGNTNMDKTQYDEENDIPGQYMYSYDGKFITFFFDKNNKIVGIRLEIL